MDMTEYSYVILKYRHDVAAGEVLNVGVVMFAPGTGQVGALTSDRYSRLSKAFAHFDGNQHRATMDRLETQLTVLGSRLSAGIFQYEERAQFTDAGAVVRSIWPDQGLSYFVGNVQYGICSDFELELRELYDRFVLSQQDNRETQDRFNDDAVWSKLRKVLFDRGILEVLQPKVLGESEIEFQHAYKNGKWHVIEPVSLDYINGNDIKQRALLAVGKAAAMLNVDDFGTFNVIVGKPRRVENEKQYQASLQLLRNIPVSHQIIDEDSAEDFAAALKAEMEAHSVMDERRRA